MFDDQFFLKENYISYHLFLLSFAKPREPNNHPRFPRLLPFANWEDALGYSPEEVIAKFVEIGLIENASLDDYVNYKFTKNELQEIAGSWELPNSGTKRELIEKMIQVNRETMVHLVNEIVLYKCTKQTENALKSYFVRHHSRTQNEKTNSGSTKIIEAAQWILLAIAGGIIGNRADDALMDIVETYFGKQDKRSLLPPSIRVPELGPMSQNQNEDFRDQQLVYDNHEFVQFQLTLAKSLLKQRLHSETLEVCERLSQISPNEYVIYDLRGQCLADMSHYLEAISAFSIAIDLNPNEFYYYASRGRIFLALKDYYDAINDFSKVIELAPHHSQSYNMRGRALLGIHDKISAIADFDKSQEIDPKQIAVYLYRSEIWESEGQRAKRSAELVTAVKNEPRNNNEYIERAICWQILREFDKAIDDLKIALTLAETQYEQEFISDMISQISIQIPVKKFIDRFVKRKLN